MNVPCSGKMAAATRSELQRLLVKKLIAKYGDKRNTEIGMDHPVNQLIRAEVGVFMHRYKKISKKDLATLEKTVEEVVRGGERPSRVKPRPRTAGSSSSSRRSVAGNTSVPNCTRQGIISQRPRSAMAKTSRRCLEVGPQGPSNPQDNQVPDHIKNEWLILETYQQLQREAKQEEDARQVQEAIRQCKRDQREQMKRSHERVRKEKMEEDFWKDRQRRLGEEHVSRQVALKEANKLKKLEERCTLAAQILENERRKERERYKRRVDEEKTLAECRRRLEEEKEAQQRRRQEIAESLRAMHKENEAKALLRERERLREAQEDVRLMRENEEKLDREQAERTAAHHRRLERYEMIGAQWASEGAGKRQREIQLAEEKRILAEAMMKEKQDKEREWRDKEALLRSRLLCSRDNQRQIEEKIARKKIEDDEEAKYVTQFRAQGQRHAAQEGNQRKELLRRQKAYADALREQVVEVKARQAAVEMTDTERAINASLLRRMRQDRTLQEKISRRLLQRHEPARMDLCRRPRSAAELHGR